MFPEKKIGRTYYRLTKDVTNPCGDRRVTDDLTRVPVLSDDLVFQYEEEDTGRVTPTGEPILQRRFHVRDYGLKRGVIEEGTPQWEAILPLLVEEELSVREWMSERGLLPKHCFGIICTLIEENKVSADDVMDVLRRFNTEGLRRLR